MTDNSETLTFERLMELYSNMEREPSFRIIVGAPICKNDEIGHFTNDDYNVLFVGTVAWQRIEPLLKKQAEVLRISHFPFSHPYGIEVEQFSFSLHRDILRAVLKPLLDEAKSKMATWMSPFAEGLVKAD